MVLTEQKTEKPTQNKLKKAKEKYGAPKSSELTSALILLIAVLLLGVFGKLIEKSFEEVFSCLYFSLKEPDIREFENLFFPLIYPMMFILSGIFLGAIFSQLIQTGWIWNWKGSKKKSEFRWNFFLIKIGLLGLSGYFLLIKESPSSEVLSMTMIFKIRYFFKKVYFVLLKLTFVLFLLGMCDFFYQKRKYYKKMHMTPQEVKQEKHETEGNQQIKNKIRQR